MKLSIRAGRILLAALLILLSLGLEACSMLKPSPVVVMPEARALFLKAGVLTPFDGWLISASAMAKLLEAAEAAQKTKGAPQ